MFEKIIFLIGFLGIIVMMIGYLFHMMFDNHITFAMVGIGFYMFIIPVIIFSVKGFLFVANDIIFEK